MKKLNVKNRMQFNQWTMALAALGVVSLASAACADETHMSQVQTALSSTTMSGYVDTAATWRPGTDQNAASGGAANIPAYSFAKNDGFSLNAVDIAIDRPEDESPWAAGYHAEFMLGPDAVGVAPAIRQAYLALRTPVGNSGIDWKVGVWDTIIGYESSSDPLNPNYTRSYGYSIEPTTHTGILGTYKVNDMVSFSAGVANGSNTGAAGGISGAATTATYESQKAYLGSVTFTAPDSFGPLKGATLSGGVINAVDSSSGTGSTTSWYAGATIPTPLSALKLGACFDYLDQHNGGGEAWVAGAYGNYQVNDKLSFNVRAEYLQNDIAGASAGTSFLYVPNGAPSGFRNEAEEVTATLQYNLWANVLSRLEFRWDHVEHGNAFGADSTGAAFRSNDFMLAANLIYQF